jgi:hypothetical protein
MALPKRGPFGAVFVGAPAHPHLCTHTGPTKARKWKAFTPLFRRALPGPV